MTEEAKLQPGQKAMSEADWAINKDCDLKKRDHKWHWKWDIQGNWTDNAVCAHCGKETVLKREPGVANG